MAVVNGIVLGLFAVRAIARIYKSLVVEENTNERVAQFIAAVVEGGLVWWGVTVIWGG